MANNAYSGRKKSWDETSGIVEGMGGSQIISTDSPYDFDPEFIDENENIINRLFAKPSDNPSNVSDFGALYGPSDNNLSSLDTLNHELNLVSDDIGSIQGIEGDYWRGMAKSYGKMFSGGFAFSTDIQDSADIDLFKGTKIIGSDSWTNGDLFLGMEITTGVLGLLEFGLGVPNLINSGRRLLSGLDSLSDGASISNAVDTSLDFNKYELEDVAASSKLFESSLVSDNLVTAPSTLDQQRELAILTNQTRDGLVNNFDSLLSELTPNQIDAIAEEPWRMQLFFGTAVETRVARQIDNLVQQDPNHILSNLQWTGRTNAPQDFIAPDGFGFDITGGSQRSILSHQSRPEVDIVISYDSIPSNHGYRFIDWLTRIFHQAPEFESLKPKVR